MCSSDLKYSCVSQSRYVTTFPVSQLEKLIEKANLSLEAQEYLQLTVFSALGMPELLGEKQ